jgi:hypothetical protein
MPKARVDLEKKLVFVEMTGLVNDQDVIRIADEIKATMKKFKPSDAAVLFDLRGFIPSGKSVLTMMRGMGRDVVSFFRKAAMIQEFSVGFHDSRRIIEPPPGFAMPTFRSEEEALRYLFEQPAEDSAAPGDGSSGTGEG